VNHIDKLKDIIGESRDPEAVAIDINDYIESLTPLPITILEKKFLFLHQEVASGQAGAIPFKILQGVNPPDFVAQIGSKQYLLKFSDIAALLLNKYMADMKAEAKARQEAKKEEGNDETDPNAK